MPSGPIAMAAVRQVNVATNTQPKPAARAIGAAPIPCAPPTSAIAAHCTSIEKKTSRMSPRILGEKRFPYSLQETFCTA